MGRAGSTWGMNGLLAKSRLSLTEISWCCVQERLVYTLQNSWWFSEDSTQQNSFDRFRAEASLAYRGTAGRDTVHSPSEAPGMGRKRDFVWPQLREQRASRARKQQPSAH